MRILEVVKYQIFFGLSVFLAFIILFGCLPDMAIGLFGDGEDGVYITASELSEKIESESVVVYDIRSPETYAKGHIPVAINADPANLRRILDNSSDKREVVIVCACGARAKEQVKDVSRGEGGIRYLYGGMVYWGMLDNWIVSPVWRLCP